MIGYKTTDKLAFVERFRSMMPARRRFMASVVDQFGQMGVSLSQNHQTKLIGLNGTLTVRVLVSRCRVFGSSHGWILRLSAAAKADVTVIACMATGNDTFKDYYCLPRRVLGQLKQITVRSERDSEFSGYRFDDLTFLKKLARRSKVKRSN